MRPALLLAVLLAWSPAAAQHWKAGAAAAAGFSSGRAVTSALGRADFRPSGWRLRPYAAAGAGMKQYRGTGCESAWQPLGQFALLTRTRESSPLLNAGAGVKCAASPRVTFRVELPSYITSFPEKVIAPAPGARLGADCTPGRRWPA